MLAVKPRGSEAAQNMVTYHCRRQSTVTVDSEYNNELSAVRYLGQHLVKYLSNSASELSAVMKIGTFSMPVAM